MLLIMLSTVASTQCGKGGCKGGSCPAKSGKSQHALMMQRVQAARAIQAQAQARQMQVGGSTQAQTRQAEPTRVGVRAGMGGRVMQVQARPASASTSSSRSTYGSLQLRPAGTASELGRSTSSSATTGSTRGSLTQSRESTASEESESSGAAESKD